MTEKVTIKRTSRILGGHLWIFSNEIVENLKDYQPGSIVRVFDRNSQFYGIGYINPHSLISVRLLTDRDEQINRDFFKKKIRDAYWFRRRFLTTLKTYRLVYSEGDMLPGLIVDVYGNVMVAQFLTLGMESLSESIFGILDEMFKPEVIVVRNDSPARRLEGLGLYKKIVKGDISSPLVTEDCGISLEVDPLEGQKTGAFLDQRFNRATFASYIKSGSKGLDLFCYSGAWGCHALRNASEVTFVDESRRALDIAKSNVTHNAFTGKASFVKEDVFNFLKIQPKEQRPYDFIVIDPPAFAKNKGNTKEALRAYRELNKMAISLLNKGGLLATSSCSHHIDRYMFTDVIEKAARDSKRRVRILEFRGQAMDHPILLNVPETEYLKCLFLEVVD